MYTPVSSYNHLHILFLLLKFVTYVYCDPEKYQMYPFNNNDLKPEIPDVDYEVDTFGARTSRKAWIDNKIIAVLDKPEIFNREGMVPFGLDNEPKGLIVAWNTDVDSKIHSINALVDTKETIYWFADEFGITEKRAFPDFMQWRFVPITSLHRNSPETLIKTDFPRELQYFVVNRYISWFEEGENAEGMTVFSGSKYGMATSEWGDGEINMITMQNSQNLQYLRRVIVTRSYESAQWGELTFVPDSAMDLNVVPGSGSWILRDQARNDVEGGGVEPIALVGEYEGLSYANLSAPYTFPPEERVTVNVCASVEYNGEDTDVVESDLGVFHITLTKGQPKPERSYPEDETFPTVEVCSTATLVTRIWPFWPDL